MITYTNIARRPSVCPSLIGMSLTAFDTLYHDFECAHQQRLAQTDRTRRNQLPRQRAIGAGRRHTYALRDRLLMALFWLKVYTTYEVIGFLFSLNKTNAEDNIKSVLATLEAMTTFTLERADAQHKKHRSVAAVMDAFPDVRLVIDAKEQRILRPKNNKDAQGNLNDIQKPFYSGKKKCHTLKNEIGVAPDGAIDVLSESVPGGANHDLTLCRKTKILDKLLPVDPQDAAAHQAAMTDKGYDGLRKDYPNHRIYQPYKARRGHPLTQEQKDYNRHLSSYRIVVEHTNAQLNKFAVLSQVYRHARENHTQTVRVVAGLVNRQIAVTPLKSYPVV